MMGEVDPGDLNGVVRASVKRRVPVVLTAAEVQKALEQLDGTPAIVCRLITTLRSHLEEVRGLHASDLAATIGSLLSYHQPGLPPGGCTPWPLGFRAAVSKDHPFGSLQPVQRTPFARPSPA